MRVGLSVTGQKAFQAALDDVRQAADVSMQEFIEDLTLATQARAVRGIQRGPASGTVYQKYNPRRTHRASAPGQYPMSDTGRLAASVDIEFEGTGDNIKGRVGTALMYGRHLEFGTSRMAARPWLMRSFEIEIADAAKKLRDELEARL